MNSARYLLTFFVITPISLFSQNLDSLNELSKQLVCREIKKSDSIAEVVIQRGRQTNNSKALGYAFKNRATNEICKGNLRQSIVNFRTAVRYLTEVNDLQGVASTINNLAIAYYRLGNLDSARIARKEQIRIALEIKDSLILAAAYQGVSSIFLDETVNDSCIYYSQKGLEVARLSGNERIIGQFLVNIGAAHFQARNFDESLKYFREARPLLEKANDLLNLGNLYHNMGGIYERFDLDSALYFMSKGTEIHKQTGDIPHLAYSYQGIADAYFKKGLYFKAIEYNLLSKELNEQTGQMANQTTVLKNLASCYTQIGQPERGIPYLNQAIEIASREGYLQKETDAYLFLSRAYEALGDFGHAYKAHIRYSELLDKYINEEKNATISELQTKYETEKKDREILTLSQQAQIQSLELSRRNTQLLGVGILLMVLVLGGVVINQRRTFKHRQAVSDMEQRFLRLQMNPHFIFNALASIQSYILQSNTKESVSYLSKFGKLMRQILEHSREEFISVKDEVEMLRNYVEIQQLRFGNRFELCIEIDPGIDQDHTKIPPLFAQPFVENAIEHGFREKQEGGKLTIKFQKASNGVSLEILDNGSGFQEVGKEEREHRSLATQITKERLKLLGKRFRSAFSLDVDTQPGIGTAAKLVLPTQV